MKKLLLAILWIAGLVPLAQAQGMPDPVKWSFTVKVLNNKEAELIMKASIDPGWHLYAASSPADYSIPLAITLPSNADCTMSGNIIEPAPVEAWDDIFETTMRYFDQPSVVFRQKLLLHTRSAFVLKGTITGQICKDVCLRLDVPFTVPVNP